MKFFIRQIRVHPRPITLFVFLLCSLYFLVIVATAGDMGWTWDEVYYFLSSQMQIAWFDALVSAGSFSDIKLVFSKDFVDAHWLWNTYHNPHPPLYKIFSSISWLVFGNILGDFTAYRLSSALLAAVLLFFLFRAIEKNYGFLPALCGSLTLFLMPRFFGHAHIAATEIALAAFWFMTCYLFYKGLTESKRVPITPSPLTDCVVIESSVISSDSEKSLCKQNQVLEISHPAVAGFEMTHLAIATQSAPGEGKWGCSGDG